MFPDSVLGFIWWFIGLMIWIAIAFWPARVAARKGHSFFWFFIFNCSGQITSIVVFIFTACAFLYFLYCSRFIYDNF